MYVGLKTLLYNNYSSFYETYRRFWRRTLSVIFLIAHKKTPNYNVLIRWVRIDSLRWDKIVRTSEPT